MNPECSAALADAPASAKAGGGPGGGGGATAFLPRTATAREGGGGGGGGCDSKRRCKAFRSAVVGMAGHAAPLPLVCAARCCNAASLAVSDLSVSAESLKLALALADDIDDGLLTLAVVAGLIFAQPPAGMGGSPAFATPGNNPTCY